MAKLAWLVASAVALSSPVASAEPPSDFALLFKVGKTWKFTAKHSFAYDSRINTWTTSVTCKVMSVTPVGPAHRSVIECTHKRSGAKERDTLDMVMFVGMDAGIWWVSGDDVSTEAQVAALDPNRRLISIPPAERSWTDVISFGDKKITRTSTVLPWRGAWCLRMRQPDADEGETVTCIAPKKGLVGARDLSFTDGYTFGTVPKK